MRTKFVTIVNDELGNEAKVAETSLHVWLERGWRKKDDLLEDEPSSVDPVEFVDTEEDEEESATY